MTYKWIVVSGNPIDGLCFTGPFDDQDDAIHEAEGFDGDWWIARLEEPELLNDTEEES